MLVTIRLVRCVVVRRAILRLIWMYEWYSYRIVLVSVSMPYLLFFCPTRGLSCWWSGSVQRWRWFLSCSLRSFCCLLLYVVFVWALTSHALLYIYLLGCAYLPVWSVLDRRSVHTETGMDSWNMYIFSVTLSVCARRERGMGKHIECLGMKRRFWCCLSWW